MELCPKLCTSKILLSYWTITCIGAKYISLPFVVLCFQQEFVFSYWCTEVGYRVHTTVCMLDILRVSANIMQFQLLPSTCFANSVHFCVETDLYWVLSIYWKACNKHTCNKIKSTEYSNGTNSKINNMHMKKMRTGNHENIQKKAIKIYLDRQSCV